MRLLAFLFASGLCSCLSLAADPATKPADDVLKKPVPAVKFQETPLADVLNFMSDVTGLKITADWNALAKLKIDVTSSVTMQEQDKTVGEILDALLLRLNPEKKLTYTIDKDTIEITSNQAIQGKDALEKTLVKLKFQRVALADVLQFLGETTQTKIIADWNALAQAGIKKNAPILLDAANETLGDILDKVFVQAGAKKNVTYKVVGESIKITAKPVEKK